MKKLILYFVTVLIMAYFVSAITQIHDCYELQNIKNDLSEDYILMNNIDCSDTKNWNDGKGFEPIGPMRPESFTGIFDGNKHVIKNLYINRPSAKLVGLFGYVGDINSNGFVKNVGLEDVEIIGDRYVGSLAGTVSFGSVHNSYSTGSVTGYLYVGGLIGHLGWDKVVNSFSTAKVTGGDYVAGLVADIGGDVINSYSVGEVSGNPGKVGGLVADGTYNSKYKFKDHVINSFYDNTICTGDCDNDVGIGKTTSEMKQQSTFGGWNFNALWVIQENISYPYFGFFWNYLDDDKDGVLNKDDKCPDTSLPESIPTKRLLVNRYADIDGDKIFETIKKGGGGEKGKGKGKGNEEDSKYTLEDTYGCSCEQILELKPGTNKGEKRYGCTRGTIRTWIK